MRRIIAVFLLILLSSGCVSSAVDKITDNHQNELMTKVFYAGAAVGGIPVVAAASPITITVALVEGWGQYSSLFIISPGYPTGAITGFAVALPFYLVQSAYRKLFSNEKEKNKKRLRCIRCSKMFPNDDHNFPLLCPECEGKPNETAKN